MFGMVLVTVTLSSLGLVPRAASTFTSRTSFAALLVKPLRAVVVRAVAVAVVRSIGIQVTPARAPASAAFCTRWISEYQRATSTEIAASAKKRAEKKSATMAAT